MDLLTLRSISLSRAPGLGPPSPPPAAAQGPGPGPSPCKDLVSIYTYVCIYVDVYSILASFTLWIY